MTDHRPGRAIPSTEALLRQALGDGLPPDLQPALAALADLIDAHLQGRAIPAGRADGADLAALLHLLAGKQIAAAGTLIAIGDESQLGDVTISDVTGGNSLKISIVGSQHIGGPGPASDEARQLEQFRLEAQERIRRQAERYDADMALLRRLSVATYRLRATLNDLRALGEYVTAEDLAGYQRVFEETRALFFESRAFLRLDMGAITHDTLALHTSLVAGIRLLLRRNELGLDQVKIRDIQQMLDRSYERNDKLFRQFIATIQEQTGDASL